ncbi:MAG: LPS export ABC transporter periplasmic protein LptC, partial [Acidobacteriota bacterium]
MRFTFTVRHIRLLALAGLFAVLGITLSSFLFRKPENAVRPPPPPKIAADINQQMQAFSLSKSSGGHTLYTIEATQVTNFKDTGKTVLQDVSILLYGKQGTRLDRITSSECEFDPGSGFLFIPGEVNMLLDAPLSGSPSDAEQVAPNPVHIITSGLSFDQNTGVASTEKEVRFRFAAGEGVSQGAIYNPQEQLLVLQSAVQLSIRPAQHSDQDIEQNSESDGTPARMMGASFPNPDAEGPSTSKGLTHVRASRLRFHRGQNKIYLAAPVQITQGNQKLEAGDSEIVLGSSHRVERALLGGGIHAIDLTPHRSAELRAGRGTLEFTAQGKVEKLLLEQDVDWNAGTGQAQREGQAQRVDILFQNGLLERIEAYDDVRIVLHQPDTFAPASASVAETTDPANSPGAQILSAQYVEMIPGAGGEGLRHLRTRASSTLQLLPAKAGEGKRTVSGETFEMQFGPESNLILFAAEGSVRVVAEASGNIPRRRVTSSDHLQIIFDPLTQALDRMQQWGNFHYQEADREARAERADYSTAGGSEEVVLQGAPRVWNSSGKISAQKIVLKSSTGEINAEGKVSTTYFSPEAERSVFAGSGPIHVVAERFHYDGATEKALYEGSARLWQGGNLLEADWLEMDRRQGRLVARNKIYSMFQKTEQPPDLAGSLPVASSASSSSHAGLSHSGLADAGRFEIRSDYLIY